MKVFINPGHALNGNPDPGAVGNGLRESDVVAKVCRKLVGYLNTAGVQIAGYLQDDSLSKVVNTANKTNADIFVSVHCNSFSDESANGTETWYCAGSEKSKLLAEHISTQIITSLAVLNRGVKKATPGQNGLYVLTNTDMPAVLIELAFISNEGDAYLLEHNTDDFARAIARGITDYNLAKIC